MTLHLLANIILLAGIPAIFLFIGFYGVRSPWKKHDAGRAVMYLAAALAVTMVTVVLTLWLGTDYPGREFVRIAAYSFTTLSLWRLFYVLVRGQRKSKVRISKKHQYLVTMHDDKCNFEIETIDDDEPKALAE